MLKEKLIKLGSETNNPCLTISLNTHRTHPDNAQDSIVLKKLCKEAEGRLITAFGKRPIASLLEKLEQIPDEIDVNYNLDSLHIFLSNDTKEIIKSTWPTQDDKVHIADSFAIRPLIKAYNRSEEYLILLLSQSGVQLFEALNDTIVEEIRNDDFPFKETSHYHTDSLKISDAKAADNMVREFLSKVDKAVVKVHHQTGLNCVIICTEDNYSRLMQVADKPTIYHGYAAIDYNNTANHKIVSQAWDIIKELQRKRRTEAISEMKEAVSQGKVLTDLQEIYRAAKEGRGELLITHQDFSQAVKINDGVSFELVQDVTQPEVIDDITSNIAWDVISKKGRAVFTSQDEIKDLGHIALKVRY
ncbi:MAG TPA: hypothetical protein VGP43_05905 [Chitinophagaceae bacterium]|nr:hypothetical protein [Chitinophagaceae bacterium]